LVSSYKWSTISTCISRLCHLRALSPLQAEAYGLELATKLAEVLQLREPRYYTAVLASAADARNITEAPGHWMIRAHIARIQASNSFHVNRIGIAHLHRISNLKAHHQARL
jgi:hypothetical protein